MEAIKCTDDFKPKCSIKRCDINTQTSYKLTYFPFPENPDLRKQWLNKINPIFLNDSDHLILCSFHFRSACIDRTEDKVILKPGSLPSINLPIFQTFSYIDINKTPELSGNKTNSIEPVKRKAQENNDSCFKKPYMPRTIVRKPTETEISGNQLKNLEILDSTQTISSSENTNLQIKVKETHSTSNINTQIAKYLTKPQVKMVHLNKTAETVKQSFTTDEYNEGYVLKSELTKVQSQLDVANEQKNGYIMKCSVLCTNIEYMKKKCRNQGQQIKALQASLQQLKKEKSGAKEKYLFMYNKKGFLSMTEFGKKSKQKGVLRANKNS